MADDRTDPQYKLRLPAELKERIEDAAKANKRSMNAEIVARLETSFSSIAPAFVGKPELAQQFGQVMDAMLDFVRDAHSTDAKLVIRLERPDSSD